MELIPALAPVLEDVVLLFNQLLLALLPLVEEGVNVLIAVMPELTELFSELIDLVVQLTPLIEIMAPLIGVSLVESLGDAIQITTFFVVGLTELITTVNDSIAAIRSFSQTALGQVLTQALMAVLTILNGDWASGWALAQHVARGALLSVAQYALDLRNQAAIAIGSMFASINSRARDGWNSFVQAAASGASRVVGAVRDLQSRALSIVGSLASSFYSAGRNLVGSFADGIRSMIGEVADAASDLVGAARDYLPFSPAKKGPLSGRGYTFFAGQAFVRGFLGGIESQAGALDKVLAQWLGKPLIGSSASVSMPSASAVGGNFGGIVAGAFTRTSPEVNVYIGNQLLRDYVQVQVDGTLTDFNRQASQGVRS